MTNSISPLFSSLYSVSLDDWITELGEKAFLAWLRFHNWKNGQATPQEPFLLPISLNKVIQRLKIGKATFYNKVLRPLLDYGLVRLQPSPDTPRELHLVVCAFPEQTPTAKSSESAIPPDKKDLQEKLPSPLSSMDTPQEDILPSVPTPDPTTDPGTEPHSLPEIQPNSPVSQGKSSIPPNGCSDHPIHTLDFLPPQLQELIMEDPRLYERRDGIIQTYQECRKHPSFRDEDFQQKMLSCINYPHDPHRFGAYLRKALLNEWNKSSSVSIKKSSQTSHRHDPKDVPEWVFQQQERQRMNIPLPNDRLNPDQQAEIDQLLKALGEI